MKKINPEAILSEALRELTQFLSDVRDVLGEDGPARSGVRVGRSRQSGHCRLWLD